MTPQVLFVYGGVPYDAYIGRGKDPQTGKFHGTIMDGGPDDFGNPWSHKDGTLAKFKTATVEEAVAAFDRYVQEHPEVRMRIRRRLRGLTLGCWCNSPKSKIKMRQPCHGDVLLRIANEDAEACPDCPVIVECDRCVD